MSSLSSEAPPQLFVVRNRRGGAYDRKLSSQEQLDWDAHARFMNHLLEDGAVLIGGPLDGDRETLLLLRARSLEALRRRLGNDPWIQNGMLTLVSIELLLPGISPDWLDAGLAANALADEP